MKSIMTVAMETSKICGLDEINDSSLKPRNFFESGFIAGFEYAVHLLKERSKAPLEWERNKNAEDYAEWLECFK